MYLFYWMYGREAKWETRDRIGMLLPSSGQNKAGDIIADWITV